MNKDISKDGRCGRGIGYCKKGECCSKYGWCGKTDKHCMVEEGCQSEFGKCKSKIIPITTTMTKTKSSTQTLSKKISDWKCGKGYGSCKKGYCCSKYGWCGKTNDYCGNRCQSEFGECNRKDNKNSYNKKFKETSLDWKCGKKYGSCNFN